MRALGIIIIILIAAWDIITMNLDGGRTMLADNGFVTIIQSDGTIKTCTQIGSGPNSTLVCN